jgi:hypothetical protein
MGHWSVFEEGGEQSHFFDELDLLIQEATERAQPASRTKRTPDYEAIDMAKRLSRFVERVLDQPLHEQVVAITNVVCDSELTRDNLKSALRSAGASRGGKHSK